MCATEMIDISIDAEMLDASISSYSYEDFLSCAPSQQCATTTTTTTTTQRCISDGTNSTADVSNMLAIIQKPPLFSSFTPEGNVKG